MTVPIYENSELDAAFLWWKGLTVSSFAFDDVPVCSDELAGHHAQTAESLGENVGLDIAIVVLACPDETTAGLDDLSDHVIDETVFVVDACTFELLLICAGKPTIRNIA